MKLKLEFEIPESDNKLNLKDSIYLMGSCFSDEIGKLLKENKFQSLSNPFGTIYNPITIFGLLKNQFKAENTLSSGDVFYHWDAHGAISGRREAEAISAFRDAQSISIDFLSKTQWLVITMGTAWVYRYKQTGEIVANCHKIPSKEFTKELLEVEQIVAEFRELKKHLTQHFPEIKIILSLSPVRHIRDGLVENNQSKAVLIESIRQIQKNHSDVSYFPSYEIMMDELRDYRFYKTDLIHPSTDAVAYIWERFTSSYFDEETLAFLKKWSRLQSALKHRALYPDSSDHQRFLKETLTKLRELNDTVDLRVEIETLSSQII